ncbi:hypothetical protein [Burkholderia cepacia]|uniref:hypothetical protein n=1 Tax=Burkholderia cepacia TaxID=292 RepID=UPI00075EEA25|nr:hypothetical protein [Burkholderia cepacia]KWH56313.1 hypothetical protein WM00_13780 [Burkholderia cepacia]
MLIKIDRNRAVNTEHIVSAKVDAYGDTYLDIELITGEKLRVRHAPHCYDGVDVYKLLDEVVGAHD